MNANAQTDRQVLITAEIGSNHDGDLGKALELVDIAAECGADIAKFQGFLSPTRWWRRRMPTTKC